MKAQDIEHFSNLMDKIYQQDNVPDESYQEMKSLEEKAASEGLSFLGVHLDGQDTWALVRTADIPSSLH